MQEWLAQLGHRLLPVRIILSRWKRPGERSPCADDLIDACVGALDETTALPDFKNDFVLTRLRGDAPSVLILLDGLDEVTDDAQRAWQLAVIEHFRARFRRVPLLVTCRVRPYTAWRDAGQGLSLPAFTLAGLSDQSVSLFIERWYDELLAARTYESAAEARQAKERLHEAIFNQDRANHEELRGMAEIPLLLTMMAHVNYNKPLPDSRAALYALFTDQLLYKWEERRMAQGQETRLSQMLAQVRSDIEQFKLAIADLAFDLYGEASSRDLVDIPSLKVEEALRKLPRVPMSAGDRSKWATELLQHITARSGLLVAPDDSTYRFSHLSLQEYMTATHLVIGSSDDKLRNFTPVVDNPLWSEVVQLAFGILAKVLSPPQIGDALHIISGLLPRELEAEPAAKRLLFLGDLYVRLLAADSLSAPNRTQAHAAMQAMAAHLNTVMTARLDPHQRLDAGLLLADLGDLLDRFDPDTRPTGLDLDPPGLDDFIAVPGLPGVRMGKYPVTVKQYRRFVEAGGYDRGQPWWTEEEIREIARWRGGEWPDAPEYWDDDRFNHATQPVVGVSWYEARAYCAWLADRLRALPAEEGGIGAGAQVALPAEAEWVQAARGGQPAPADENEDYPWRGPFATWRANTEENRPTDLGQTSPVAMYPGGATDAGIFDLAGNVWEWTRDKSGGGGYWLKGGSWYWSPDRARPAARGDYVPRGWYDSWGFRVVVVPISRIGSDS